MADKTDTDQDFDSFENLDDAYSDPVTDDMSTDDLIDDAEFQDLADGIDSDVFEDDAAPTAPAKKKTNWFNIIIAVVAVGGAAVLVLTDLMPKMTGGDTSMTMAEAPAGTPEQNEVAAQAALEPIPAVPGSAPTGGMLDNPDAFADLANTAMPNAQGQPAPIQQPETNIQDPFAALNKAAPAFETAAESAVPMPAPITAEPQPVVAAPVIEAAPVMPVVADVTQTQVVPVADTAAVSAIQGQVDTLSNRMNSIESKLDAALSAASQTQAVSVPADDARFATIQNSLERLESRLNDMASAPRTQAVSQSQPDLLDEEPAPVRKKAMPKKATPAKAKKKTTTASSDEWDDAYKGSTAAAAVTTPASSGGNGGWDLRGAQPGSAIIGQSSGDIRQVSVGDSVPGIGQVTGIAPINGRWVVQGTQGRIAQ